MVRRWTWYFCCRHCDKKSFCTLTCYCVNLLLHNIFLCPSLLYSASMSSAALVWHPGWLLCMFPPGKHPADETQIPVGYIRGERWRSCVSICSRTMTTDDLSVCQSFVFREEIKKKIHSTLQQYVTANNCWALLRAGHRKRHEHAGRARKKEKGRGIGRRKSEAEEKESVRGAWCDACVMAMFTAAVSAQSPFGRMTTGMSSPSLWPARPICECVHVCARVSECLGALFWSTVNICFILVVCVRVCVLICDLVHVRVQPRQKPVDELRPSHHPAHFHQCCGKHKYP